MTDREEAIRSMFGPLHYGIRYPTTGNTTDREDDLDGVLKEIRVLRGKGIHVELVQRKIGPWRRSGIEVPA